MGEYKANKKLMKKIDPPKPPTCVECGRVAQYQCSDCKQYVCDDCKIEDDVCPNCAPHSLEEIEEEE